MLPTMASNGPTNHPSIIIGIIVLSHHKEMSDGGGSNRSGEKSALWLYLTGLARPGPLGLAATKSVGVAASSGGMIGSPIGRLAMADPLCRPSARRGTGNEGGNSKGCAGKEADDGVSSGGESSSVNSASELMIAAELQPRVRPHARQPPAAPRRADVPRPGHCDALRGSQQRR